jgi:hypothetical protein
MAMNVSIGRDSTACAAVARKLSVHPRDDRSMTACCCNVAGFHAAPGSLVKRTAAELIEVEARLGAHNYRPLDVVLTRGSGVWVWDAEGKRWISPRTIKETFDPPRRYPYPYMA